MGGSKTTQRHIFANQQALNIDAVLLIDPLMLCDHDIGCACPCRPGRRQQPPLNLNAIDTRQVALQYFLKCFFFLSQNMNSRK